MKAGGNWKKKKRKLPLEGYENYVPVQNIVIDEAGLKIDIEGH